MDIAEFSAETLARLARCARFWEERGYHYVSLPWSVPERYVEATRPPHGTAQPAVLSGHLVASGEQSFLQLAAEGKLPGMQPCVGWSPCFRHEPRFDATHHFYFLKVELFVPLHAHEGMERVEELIVGSREWVCREVRRLGLTTRELLIREVTADQWDLELAGLELGSYGIREHCGVRYAYGTGCAEPRMSQALALL